jgi:hypothetical protein
MCCLATSNIVELSPFHPSDAIWSYFLLTRFSTLFQITLVLMPPSECFCYPWANSEIVSCPSVSLLWKLQKIMKMILYICIYKIWNYDCQLYVYLIRHFYFECWSDILIAMCSKPNVCLLLQNAYSLHFLNEKNSKYSLKFI